MKKRMSIVLMLITVLIVGMLSACSSSGNDEVKYSDDEFLKSLGKGLEARWALQEKQENSDTVESMREAIQTELDAVSDYKTATFEDSVLQEKALKYINILDEALENVEYYNSTTEYEKWTDIYDQRTIMIKDFVDNYGLTVSSKYEDTLSELAANGKTAGANAAKKETIEKLAKGLDFEVTKEEYGWKTYEAILENTTDYDIKDLSLEISLLDADGVIVSTEYASADNISKGQKARLEFQTDNNFDRYEVVVSWFETN